MNTLFPLGPGLPFRPSGPLFPFMEVQMLVSEAEHWYSMQKLSVTKLCDVWSTYINVTAGQKC